MPTTYAPGSSKLVMASVRPLPDLRALAELLAVPGTQAITLQANVNAGKMPIAEAIRAGVDFCIEVRADVLVADSDLPNDPSVDRLRAIAEEHGLQCFVEKSGGPGRHHLWILGVDQELGHYLLERGAALGGLDFRHGTNRIRPPGVQSSKPGAVVPQMLDPIGFADAVRALPSPPSYRLKGPSEVPAEAVGGKLPTLPFRELDPVIEAAARAMAVGDERTLRHLRPGWFIDGTLHRHIADVAIALSAVNRGWTREQFKAHRLAPATRSPRLEGVSAEAADRYLDERWESAVGRYLSNPPAGPSAALRAELSRFRAAVLADGTLGRRKDGVVRLAEALIQRASRVGLEFSYSERDLALALNRDPQTVRTHLRDLQGLGLLRKLWNGNGDRASRWVLTPPAESQFSPIRPSTGGTDRMGEKWDSPVSPLHPIWGSGGGLGGRALPVYLAVGPVPTGVGELVGRGIARSVAFRWLARLTERGLLLKDDDGLYRWNPTPNLEDEGSEARASLESKADRFVLERDLYGQFRAAALQRRLDEAWATTGGTGTTPVRATGGEVAVDLLTGETLTPSEAYARMWAHSKAAPLSPILRARSVAQGHPTRSPFPQLAEEAVSC